MSKLTDLLLADAYVGGGSGGGGEKWTETLLWENPSPNTSYGGEYLTVENLAQYEFIRVLSKLSISNNIRTSIIIDCSVYDKSKTDFQPGYLIVGDGTKRQIAIYYPDRIRIDNATSTNSTSAQARGSIPLAIYGIKKG